MKTSTRLQIIARVTLHILVYGALGTFMLGTLAARVIGLAMLLLNRNTTGFSWLGFLLGAVFMIAIGLGSGRRRDQWESFQMIFGGCVLGGIVTCLPSGFAAVAAWYFWGDVLGELIMWLQILCGMIIGTLYFTLHPKFAPREEPVIIFSDDYLKDEKIEWK